MTRNQASSDHQTTSDEDYIDMEVSPSSSNFFCYSITSSPPHTKEFEFQMSSHSTTTAADELFYNGTLLPLHLPPRLQMVQNIMQTSNTTKLDNQTQQAIDQRLNLSFIKTNINNTPLDMSCNISPLDSPKVSSELNPDDHLYGWREEINVCNMGEDDSSKKSNWSRKLKEIKHSLMSPKIKASRQYVKSFFFKPTTSESREALTPRGLPLSSFTSESNAELENGIKGKKELLNKYTKVGKKNPFGKFDNGRCHISSSTKTTNTLMKSIEKEMAEENGYIVQSRKSFSGAFQPHYSMSSSSSSTTSSVSSSSSSSFSFSSSGCSDYSQFLKRSVSANCESESSIEGAIAHCKQSHGVKRQQDLSNDTFKAMRETHMIAS